jgi:hypothetical protein
MIGLSTDYNYPMRADIYYSSVEQGTYGNIKKQWMLDRTIDCYFAAAGLKNKDEQMNNNVAIIQSTLLLGRTKEDVRVSSLNSGTANTNILITNIRDSEDKPMYVETSGIRAGKSTLFEIGTVAPFAGLFAKVEYYKLVVKRSDNQAVDL